MTDTENKEPAALQVGVRAQYIKDFSFESPSAPQIFAGGPISPEIEMSVNVQSRSLGDSHYEALLTLKMDAKMPDKKTAFIAELVYGGVFAVPALPEDQLKMFLLVEAPRILFPFARLTILNALHEGGFPNVMIQPIDFLSLYLANKDSIGTMPAAGAA